MSKLSIWPIALQPAWRGHWRERSAAVLGVGVGIAITEGLSRWVLGESAVWFVLPMGASAVIVFALPASPLAQPWPVIGGNVISALCGVALYTYGGATGLAASSAAALAVALMFSLRCLHPPGGAMALTAVLGGSAVHHMGWTFALWPVALNCALLLACAWGTHRLFGRSYPHHAASASPAHATQDPVPSHRGGISPQDLAAALREHDELLDIDKGDLAEVLARAQMRAHRRQMGDLSCGDIMSRDVVSITPEAAPQQAWDKLALHRIKSLPVVDAAGRLQGMVSLPDFFIDRHDPRFQEVPRMRTVGSVAELMSHPVRAAQAAMPLADLMHLFSDGGLHQLPVTDAQGQLVGMVTQSDLVGALFQVMSQVPTARS